MTNAALDRLLAVLVAAVVATGLLTLRAGSPELGWLFVAHGLLAGSLLAAASLKLERSVPRAAARRKWRRLGVALVIALVTLVALSGGLLWVASGTIVIVGGWTLLTLHAWAGLALVPLLVLHLLPRRWRLLRPGRRSVASASRGLISRRSFLWGTSIGLGGLAVVGGAGLAELATAGHRRFTGSRLLPGGGTPPATTFLGDSAPSIEPAAWRLMVRGAVAEPLSVSLEQLRALGETTTTAVLDCTSGWALETDWQGVPLSAVIDAAKSLPTASHVEVRSATGWGTTLELGEARAALLATGVGGGPLPSANGAPCRLVAPGHRGLDWVKWVTEVVVS